jgi:hypothetical protein
MQWRHTMTGKSNPGKQDSVQGTPWKAVSRGWGCSFNDEADQDPLIEMLTIAKQC